LDDSSSSEESEEENDDEPPAYVVRTSSSRQGPSTLIDAAPFSSQPVYKYGKNKTKWSTSPIQAAKGPPTIKVIRRGYGKPFHNINPQTPGEAFKLFFTPDIVQEVITETNREAKRKLALKKKGSWKDISESEFWGFLGIVLLAGVQKQAHVPIRELFQDPRSDPMYRATMSVTRFEEIRSNMRFDDRSTRKERKQSMGRLAPIKKVFDIFNNNLRKAYEPHAELTIDEQQHPYHGRCPIIQFNPAKPAKYGIKVFWICDAVNGYALTGKIYTGKEDGQVSRDLASKVTKELAAGFYDSGRVLTMDNFFTSLPLVEYLAENKLAVVGTVRSNKPDLPPVLKERGNRALYSSLFAFRPKVMLVSYVAKKKKVVNFLSSMHSSGLVDTGEKRKPEVALFYNKTKIGVDLMDQKVADYSCARITRRWPMASLYNMADIGCANGEIIFHILHPSDAPDHRRLFLKELAKELALPQMHSRFMSNIRLRGPVIDAMKIFGFERVEQSANLALLAPQATAGARVRCRRCENDTKASKKCQYCQTPACGAHMRSFCDFCIKRMKFV